MNSLTDTGGVLIIDDHLLLAESLAGLLRADGFLAEALLDHRPESVAHIVADRRPRVVLLDLDLGGGQSGLDLIPLITERGAAVVVVTGTSDELMPGRCLEAGAEAVVPKEAGPEVILDTLRTIAAGRAPLSHAARERALAELDRARQHAGVPGFAELTSSEAKTLAGLMAGHSAAAIAEIRYVSLNTVRTQIRAVLTKLEVSSQLEAVSLAFRSNWTTPADV